MEPKIQHYTMTPLSRALLERRMALSWSRTDLATNMGYRNISRGCQRIAQWERGCTLGLLDTPNGVDTEAHKELVDQVPPTERLQKLSEALDLSLETLIDYRASILSTFASSHARYLRIREFKRHTQESERYLIKAHCKLLLDHAYDITTHNQFSAIQLSSCGVRASFLGAADYTLADLLALASGELRSACAACGGDFWNLKVSGSVLSGAHTAAGFCDAESCDQTTQCLPEGLKFGRFARACLKVAQSGGKRSSHWSLVQLIHYLGGSVPAVEIYSNQFEVFAHYDPNALTLFFESPSLEVDLRSVFETETLLFAPSTLNKAPEYLGSENTKRITIQSLEPLQFGAFVGNALHVDLGAAGVWRYQDGALADPAGAVVALMKVDPPPALLFALAHHLSEHQTMEEPSAT